MHFCDFVAGCIAGSAGILIGHPLDTIKVRLQTLEHRGTLWTCVRNTYYVSSYRGFFRGLSFPFVSGGAINCLFFGVYGNVCQLFQEKEYGKVIKTKCPNCYAVYFAGCCAGVVQLIVYVPMDLVKVKLQAGNDLKLDSVALFYGLWRSGGFRACYKGLTIQAIRDVPACGLYSLAYEWALYQVGKHSKSETLNALLAGGISGVAGWVFIIPLDVLKSRIQSDCYVNPKYDGIVDCAVKSYREGGLGIFTKGLGPVALRAFVTNAVTLYFYSLSLGICQ